jgi:hypothetical protein
MSWDPFLDGFSWFHCGASKLCLVHIPPIMLSMYW